MPEPSRLLPVYEEARAALMALHENIVQTHAAHNTWVQPDEAPALKRVAKGALGKRWSFHQAHSLAAAAALRRVAVLLVTVDVALKIFGRSATPGSPAARLLMGKQSTALILDEMQRCPVETFCALGSRHDTVVAVGSRGQEIPDGAQTRRGRPLYAEVDPASAPSVCWRVTAGTGSGCAWLTGQPESLPPD